MRIAYVSTIRQYAWGGADALWTRSAENAQEKGHELMLVVNDRVAREPRIETMRAGGAKLVVRESVGTTTPSLVSRARRRFFPKPDAALAAVAAFRPDLVVFSFGGAYDLAFEPAWCDWVLGSQTRFRIIVNYQDERPWLGAPELQRIQALFPAANRLFFLSERNREITAQHLLSPLNGARVIHNALRWQPSDVTAWPDTEVWQLATVARMEPIKGLDLLLHAAQRALPLEASWKINLYGAGPQKYYLENTAAHLGLGRRVHFHGFVPGLRSIWEKNHLLVSPALAEGGPLTLPEAMLCGRPVLATRVGIAEEWIQPQETGFLAESARVSRLSEALREAWEFRDDWQEMGRAASARVLRDYRFTDYLSIAD